MTSELFKSFNNESSLSESNSSKNNQIDKDKEMESKKGSQSTLNNSKEKKNINNSSSSNEDNGNKLEDNNKYLKLYEQSLFTNSEELKEFICPLCSKVFDEPTMELCGCLKVYCKNCLMDYMAKNGNKCPFSKNVITREPQPVPLINFTINSFEIKCRNYKYGCGWKGKCGKYKEHLKKYCLKEYIQCTNNGCNELIMKENMNRHLKECKYRYILCKLCNSKVQYIDRKKHEEMCNNKNDEDGPKGCGEEIEKKS